MDTDGAAVAGGDADHEFPIMSVSTPLVFTLVCERLGAAEARRRLGANATGLPFNSLAATATASKGELAARHLWAGLGLDLLSSQPAG